MSLINLNRSNFHVAGMQRKTLNINIPDTMLVFFKMTTCPGCEAFESIFMQLISSFPSIKYGIMNVEVHQQVIQMSRQTSTPIVSVPTIILYTNGRPYAKFNGKKNLASLRAFLHKAVSSIPPPQQQNYHTQVQRPNYPPQQQPPQQQHAKYQPEFGSQPNMKNAIRGNVSDYSTYMGETDEDEEKLTIPENITPHNMPWESDYRKIGSID